MNIVKIKGIELGKGSPKICVPVTGRTKEEIRLRLEELQEAEPESGGMESRLVRGGIRPGKNWRMSWLFCGGSWGICPCL